MSISKKTDDIRNLQKSIHKWILGLVKINGDIREWLRMVTGFFSMLMAVRCIVIFWGRQICYLYYALPKTTLHFVFHR